MDSFLPLRDAGFEVGTIVFTTVDDEATYGDPLKVYEWASVTKLVTTWAALIAVEQGKVSLDDAAGPAGSTLRHLLSHASGLPFDKGPALAMPGVQRIYSNSGIEAAAAHVESKVGLPFAEWVARTVFKPLGMDTCEFYGSPAHGLRGSAVDLAEFGRGVMNCLSISEELMRQAFTPQFPTLKGVLPGYGRQDPNPWGLGFEIRGNKYPHWTGRNADEGTVGHFGWSGSFLWIDPRRGLGMAFLGERPFSESHQDIWPDLSDRVLASHAVLD